MRTCATRIPGNLCFRRQPHAAQPRRHRRHHGYFCGPRQQPPRIAQSDPVHRCRIQPTRGCPGRYHHPRDGGSLMYTCSWRWVGRTAILCSLVGVLGCKAKEHPAEVEEELTLETIKGHRSEADLPHLHTPSKRQQALYQEAMTALQDGDEAQALHALQRLRQTETISALKRDEIGRASCREADGRQGDGGGVQKEGYDEKRRARGS